MTTKTKLMLIAVVLMLVVAVAMFTAVSLESSVAAGFYLPDVAGDVCGSTCTGG
ncbi:MAG TPA: hypothetical protein PLD25_04370 [Chloroflexota bacterium]|nr:hypothetical protein [Chloroflexota bacterium]HUM69720.1 hypothetical protein [Chloroflexota bacterium]